MKNFFNYTYFLFFIFLGCQNNIQKSYQFVEEYNQAASSIENAIIYRTSAQINKDSISKGIINIDIDFDLNLKKDECENDLGVKMLPKAMTTLLLQNEVRGVIEEGGKINLTFRSFDNYIIDKLTIDKKQLGQLIPDNQTKSSSDSFMNDNKNKELTSIIELLNQNLPIENKDKTRLLKIALEGNNIICYTEIPDDIAALLKNEAAKSIIKESILREGRFKNLLLKKSEYGIGKIIYHYQNSKGKLVTEIALE